MSFASSSKLSTETLGRGLRVLDRGMSGLSGVKQELQDDEEQELQKQIQEHILEKV